MSTQELRPGLELPSRIIERESARSAGIALLIVGVGKAKNGDNQTDPLYWTVRELEDKPSTSKYAGDISIPAETRKIGETRASNVLGALAEFCDDGVLACAREHLFLIDGVFKEKGIWVNGNPVDISVLIYDGDVTLDFIPHDNAEVNPNGWLHRSEILEKDRVRTVLFQAISVDVNEGLSLRALETYYNNPQLLKPVFPADFNSMEDFYRERELLMDVPLRSV